MEEYQNVSQNIERNKLAYVELLKNKFFGGDDMVEYREIGRIFLANVQEPFSLYARLHWQKEMDIRIFQFEKFIEFKFCLWTRYDHQRVYLSKRTKNPSVPIKEMSIDEIINLPPLYENLGFFDLKNRNFSKDAKQKIVDRTMQIFKVLINSLYKDERWELSQHPTLLKVDSFNKVHTLIKYPTEKLKGNLTNDLIINTFTIEKDPIVSNPVIERTLQSDDLNKTEMIVTICQNCLERFDCFQSYSYKTDCQFHRPGPTKRPEYWPEEILGPYGK